MARASVLVAGAGPTGLALACDLRRRGIDAQVVESLRRPPVTTRALGIQPRGRQILDRLGALGELERIADRRQTVDILVDGKLSAHIDMGSWRGPDRNNPLRAPQTAIEERLRERLRELGAEVRWGWAVSDIRQDTDGVDVIVESPEGSQTIRADWLIGCDGAHSVCRKLIGAKFEGGAYPQTFLLGDVRLTESHERGPTIFLRSGQILVTAPLPSGRTRVGVALPPGDPLAAKGGEGLTADRDKNSTSVEEGLARLQELYTEYSGDSAARLEDATWLSVFRIHRRMASTFRRGRVLIAGDAAHLTSPLGGQGVNTGLNDAFNLGWKLAFVIQGRADERLIDTYEAERRPAVERIDRATAAWTSVLFGDSAGARFVRRWIVLPAMRSRYVQAWVLTRRGALQSSYHGGPLAQDAKTGPLGRACQWGPQSGDGAPDVECRRRADSGATTVGREIGPNWGLIVFGSGDEATGACQAAASKRLGEDLVVLSVVSGKEGGEVDADRLLEDPGGKVARAYGARAGAAILVRPDGHIAWRSAIADRRGLEAWIDGALLEGRAG
ncbi:MAG: FAD-dependent monooxygenase [Roseiarcus sp.]